MGCSFLQDNCAIPTLSVLLWRLSFLCCITDRKWCHNELSWDWNTLFLEKAN
jgi:hypothetical protein